MYIRQRDTLFGRGYGHCITCEKRLHWAEANAGHYIEVGTATQGTEFDERNVHLQCVHCNNWLEGRKASYTLWMIKNYDIGIIEELVQQSKWSLMDFVNRRFGINDNQKVFDNKEAYEYLIKYYQEKLNELG